MAITVYTYTNIETYTYYIQLRCIRIGNYLSKKRCQQPSQPVNKLKKVCASSNHQSFNAPIYNDRHNYGTVIIIAGASTEIERVAKSSERRFTIPNVKGNYNIAIQQFENSHGYLSKVFIHYF